MILGILMAVFALVLGTVAILTAWRMSPFKPVAPTVPQVTPRAAVPTPACNLSFTLTAPQALKCGTLKLVPGSTSVSSPGETRILTATASGGTAPLTYSWTQTSSGNNKGTLSGTGGGTVTWTAPQTLTDGQTWTISAKVTDAKANSDTGNCNITLTYHAAPQTLKCVSLTMSPSQGTITSGGETRSLSVTSSGGIPPVGFSWNTATNGTNSGQLSAETGTSVTWTAPAVLPSVSQNWTITATASDSAGATNVGSCTTNLSYTYTPATVSATHKTCQNNSCVTVAGAGTNSCNTDTDCQTTPQSSNPTHKECQNNACVLVAGAGTDTCTSDVSCRSAATPPAIPQTGTGMESLGIAAGGVLALLLGLLAL